MALNPEFAENPDPRCACVLLLDTSGSMSGSPIDALNQGLQTFQSDIQEDALAKRRVEIAIVTFGSPRRVNIPWRSIQNLPKTPTLAVPAYCCWTRPAT